MIFIAFTGVKGSGKTTVSGFLKDLDPSVQEITLAKRLKDASAAVFKLGRNSFDDPAVKEKELDMPVQLDEKNVKQLFDFFEVKPDFDQFIRPHIGTILHSPRRIAQYVGTEILRNYDKDIHCRGAVLGVNKEGLYVVTDMRFTGEFDFFQTNYGKSFHPFYVQNSLAERKVDNHPSEMQVFEVAKHCTKISNNGTLNDLYNKIKEIYTGIVTGNERATG